MELQIDGYDRTHVIDTVVVLVGGGNGLEWTNKSFHGDCLVFVSGGKDFA